VAIDEIHRDRDRAGSFGTVAEQYDRFRPRCPDELIDELAAPRPARVLDIGCGTGKATVALAARGLAVLGVELDERMAAMARGHGVPVEVGDFETWDDAGRQFDLITCSDAWHWIDPDRGLAKVGRLLRPGGMFARFWNYHLLSEDLIAAFDAAYRAHAPGLRGPGAGPGDTDASDTFAKSELLTDVETRNYRSTRIMTGDDWAGLVATFSDHQALEPDRLTALQQALRETIGGLGGTVEVGCETYAMLAGRTG
jgi:SAM-dependent methyltransferase